MHWRRFRIDDIPINNSKAFEVWLRNRWREKDYMLEFFNKNNRFPADNFWKEHLEANDVSSNGQSVRSLPKPAINIETEVKSASWNEFVKIFAPITSVMMALTVAYGAAPNDLPFPGGTQFFEQHMRALLSGGDMKGLPSPDELEKLIEGAARLGAEQTASPKDQGDVQKLTQANLARLVKETAIKSGMVMPGSKRRAMTSLPAPPNVPIGQNRPTIPKAKSAANIPSTQKKIATQPVRAAAKPKPTPPGPMQTVMTKSGIAIKVPKVEVEAAKKTGTIRTKTGQIIKVGKTEIEEAQKKKGDIVMTSSGVPIKITPSGAITIQQPPSAKPPATQGKPSNTVTKTPTPSKPIQKVAPQSKGAQRKINGPPQKILPPKAPSKIDSTVKNLAPVRPQSSVSQTIK